MNAFKVMFAISVTFWAPQIVLADIPMLGQTLLSESARQNQVELALEIVQTRTNEVGEFLDRIMGPQYKLKPLSRTQDRALCLKLGVLFGEVFELMRLTQHIEDDEIREGSFSLMVSSLTLNTYCGVKPTELIPQPLLKEIFADLKIKSLSAGDIKALDQEFMAFQELLGSIWSDE